MSELLIRKTVQELVRVKGDLQVRRQYFLWDQLVECRQYGLDDLAVYFLQANRDRVKVLLPPAMEYHNDAQAYYTCARTFAILYYQIPVCQRDALFRSLYKALKDEVLHGVLDGEDSGALDAVQDLYLAMRAEKLTRQLHFWEAMCYTKHALDKNAKDDEVGQVRDSLAASALLRVHLLSAMARYFCWTAIWMTGLVRTT